MPDVNKLIAFENGELSYEDSLAFVASLVKTGLAWQLQGFYGREAADFIAAGLISEDGEVL